MEKRATLAFFICLNLIISKMSLKKIWPLLFLMTVLVGFPALSWYYLRGGIDYRKEVLKELSNKVSFDQLAVLDSVNVATAKGKILLMDIHGEKGLSQKIFNQFKSSSQYFYMLSTNGIGHDTISTIQHEQFEGVVDTFDYLLIDGDNNLRYKYTSSDSDIKLLIKHIATLIPFVEKNSRRDSESSNSVKK